MDNLSHTVAGLAAGEFVHRTLAPEANADNQRTRHRLLLVACWLASNFPDLDLFLTPLLPAPLGYLMHHRGHTHTLLYAIPQALLLWAAISLLWPSARRLMQESRNARHGFILALGLGFVLHLLMDYLNSYGIHPFHPFESRWLYGDMVFIIEPVFWVALGVPMAMMAPHPALRAALLALLIGAPLFFTVREFLSWGSFAALALIAVVTGVCQHAAGARGRQGLLAGLGLCIGFLTMQGLASWHGRQTVAQTLQERNPAGRVLDVAMNAFPVNPLCWTFISVQSDEATGSYTLQRGILSLAPALLPPAACPAGFAQRPLQKSLTPAIAILYTGRANLDTLRALKTGNCHFEAWLRFARAPALSEGVATDIRFGTDPTDNFTTFPFADFSDRECAGFIPGWRFPRADLLGPAVEDE